MVRINNFKNSLLILLAVGIFVLMCSGLYYMAFYESTDYYSQIDNSKYKIDKNNSDANYEYTLESYDEDGNSKSITFNVNRELKEGAYIKFKYMKLRGVISWEEVKLEDMPRNVRNIYE